MAENYEVPLSYKMTMYGRDKQNPEWYNNNLIAIKTRYREHGNKIAKECKRRNILHYYDTFTEDIVDGWPVTTYKVKIKETGLKVQQLADWAIMKFNAEDMLITDEGWNVTNVWIQIQDEKK